MSTENEKTIYFSDSMPPGTVTVLEKAIKNELQKMSDEELVDGHVCAVLEMEEIEELYPSRAEFHQDKINDLKKKILKRMKTAN